MGEKLTLEDQKCNLKLLFFPLGDLWSFFF